MDYQNKIYLDVGNDTLADITNNKSLGLAFDLTVGQWEKRKKTGFVQSDSYMNNAVDNDRAWRPSNMYTWRFKMFNIQLSK